MHLINFYSMQISANVFSLVGIMASTCTCSVVNSNKILWVFHRPMLALESWRKGTVPLLSRSPVVDERRTRPGHCFRSVLCVPGTH